MTVKPIYADNLCTIDLGRQGENLARQIVFDLQDWIHTYGRGTVQFIVQRNGDSVPYPVPLTVDGDTAIWEITGADTAKAGYGSCELLYYVGDVLAKSEIRKTYVARALGGPTEEPPAPYQSWVDDVLQASTAARQGAQDAEESASAAEQSAQKAAESAETAQDNVRKALEEAKQSGEFDGPQGPAGEIGPAGPAGPKGDKGEKGDQGTQGERGLQGEQGIQGVKGDKGDKGDTGATGPKGDTGSTGPAGYTPVKGIDYFDGAPGAPGEKGEKGDPFTYADFTPEQLEALRGPQGNPGSDANVTAENIESALGYVPAGKETVDHLSQDKLDKPKNTPDVGNVLTVQSVGADGTFQAQWSDAPNGIFVCEYGVTTFDEVSQAINDGLLPIVPFTIENTIRFGKLNSIFDNSLYSFTAMFDNQVDGCRISVSKDNKWNYMRVGLNGSAPERAITLRELTQYAITCANYDFAVKAAMCDGKGAAWTADEQAAARSRMGTVSSDDVTTMINEALGVIENGTY